MTEEGQRILGKVFENDTGKMIFAKDVPHHLLIVTNLESYLFAFLNYDESEEWRRNSGYDAVAVKQYRYQQDLNTYGDDCRCDS